MKRKLLYLGLALLLLLGWVGYALFGPVPAVKVGKSTTYLTEPLAEDGLPNYVLALDAMQSEGVTPENNAAVPFLRAMGPDDDMSMADFQRLCRAVGLDPTRFETADGQIIDLHTADFETLDPATGEPTAGNSSPWLGSAYEDDQLHERLAVQLSKNKQSRHWESASWDAADDQERTFNTRRAAEDLIDQTQSYPWTAKQIPALARWVEGRQRPLDLIVQAVSRPHLYLPSVPALKDPQASVLDLDLSHLQTMRQASRQLSLRLMLHVGEGDLQTAWSDCHAILQLGEHLHSKRLLVDQLVALAIRGVGIGHLPTLLSNEALTEPVARQILDDLLDIEDRARMASALNMGERLFGLDITLRVTNGRFGKREDLATLSGTQLSGLEKLATRGPVDANPILQSLNQWYDRLVAAAKIENYDQRIAAFDLLETDLRTTTSTSDLSRVVAIISPDTRREVAAKDLTGLLLPAIRQCAAAEVRLQTNLDLARVAAALALYRTEQGSYPTKLTQLVPSALTVLPLDRYSGKPFVYERRGEGFLLYSVFENQTDDGGDDYTGQIVAGEWIDQQVDADYEQSDLVIRIPVPTVDVLKAASEPLPEFDFAEDLAE